MSPLPSLSCRLVLMAGLLALALPGCGRRGAPEAPLTAAEIAAQKQTGQAQGQQAQADDGEDDGVRGVTVPTPTATRRRSRAYTVPKEPFVLDPLL